VKEFKASREFGEFVVIEEVDIFEIAIEAVVEL